MDNKISACYRVIVCEFGFLNPKKYYRDMVYYYKAHNNWPRGEMVDIMRYWMSHRMQYMQMEPPELNAEERKILRTFVDAIEPRLAVRMFDVLEDFEARERHICFAIDEDKAQLFAAWLETLPLADILAAYKKEVKVRIYQPKNN